MISSQPHPEAATHAFEGSPLFNEDLAPTTLAQRTWEFWSIASLWISMSACITTYTLASSLISGGMNWWQAVLTIFAGNAIVLVPMVLNGYAGTKYGIPFPVYCRASFGTRGANLPAMVRALVACGWFGIQTWIGGLAILAIAAQFHPEWADATRYPKQFGITEPQFIAFVIFWAINMIVIMLGIESIRMLLNIKAPLLIALGLALLGWAAYRAHGFGPMLSAPSAFSPGQPKAGRFWEFFFPALTGVVGYWATLSLNIPDFTRYAKTQRDQIYGQALGLPPTMALYSFIGVAVTSATSVIYGRTIWEPTELLSKFESKTAIIISMGAIVIATLATNIAANVVSPANDFANLAPRWIGFRLGGLITGLVGIAIMPWKLYADPHGYIFTWLIGSSSLLGAVGGVLICDYWVLRRARLSIPNLFDPHGRYEYDRGVNWCAVLAVCVAVMPVIPGFIDTLSGHHLLQETPLVAVIFRNLYNYSWFVTFAISFVAYALLMIASPATNEPIEAVVEEEVIEQPLINLATAIPVVESI
ncbi:MAG: NCS1 family nucleobase:cation symporter-1 [Phycisphaerae bacterium]|nr:NCS1 family nucleobase:cation symporter-1 [Phycisphaerae bacterium]